MPIFFLGPGYLVVMLAGGIAMGWAQWRVRSAFNRYSKVPSAGGLTGAQVARRLLDAERLQPIC